MNSIFSGMEKLSLVDYDNHLSCTLFTSLCNFRCSYCHNSSLMEDQPKLSMDEIIDYLKKRKGVIDAVVVTGGEPTLHKELPDALKTFKDLGYMVKLDTNGTNPLMVKTLVENNLVDYIAVDIKSSFDTLDSLACVKVNKENLKQTIEYLINSNIDYEFRTTLIKEFHDKEDIEKIGELIKGAKRHFLQKFTLRETVLDQSLTEVDKEDALVYQEILKKYVKEVNLRGYK